MPRVRVIYYWKKYLTKARYRYKRYILLLPKSIGDQVDTSIDYEVKLVDKLIVITPKHHTSVASTIAKLDSQYQNALRDNCDSSKSSCPSFG